LDFFRVSLFDQILVFHTHPGGANRLVDVLVAGLLEFKAFTLFSFLFGVGIGVQTERLSAREVDATRFSARRFVVLLDGLFGRLGSMPAALIGIGIYIAQLRFSRAWLQHYRFGPAEWVWRSLTYGKRQPTRNLAGNVPPETL
jgi:uncharacterized membrane protein YeiB